MGAARGSEHDATEGVGVQGLRRFVLHEGLAPVHGRELEHPGLRPAQQQAERVPHVAERLDLVQAAAREQGDEGGVHVGTVVAADEESVLPAHDLTPQVRLADVIAQRQPAVVEEAAESDLLLAGVVDSLRHRRFVEDAIRFLVASREEAVGDGGGARLAELPPLLRAYALPVSNVNKWRRWR
jgi:hypothetical protein